MNWYLLNLPLVAVIATAVVAPIMAVARRDGGSHNVTATAAVDVARLGLVPAAKAPGPQTPMAQDVRELALV